MSDPDERPTLEALASSPGSAKWAESLEALRDAEPSPRRAELFRLAEGLRGVLHRLIQTSAPVELIAQTADELERIAARFEAIPNASIYEGFAESANAGEPFAFFDHSPMLGPANPLAPPLKLWMEDGRVVGTVTFDSAYEGPPGCVHGGYVAAAFDELLGTTQSLSGAPGMTGRLTVHYRSPTPLHTELRLIGELERVSGRKISTKGYIYAGDVLCAESEGLFITMNMGKFAELKAKREELQQREVAPEG